ncbi:MAG TPA: hypothetical protein VFT50_13755 [Baekduia sp.]|nr:hypothetical protein [Baekduia sp.]
MSLEATTPTIGAALERRRLEHRARRVQRVLAALEDRVAARRGTGPVPGGLREAIRDFERELGRVRERLRGLPSG